MLSQPFRLRFAQVDGADSHTPDFLALTPGAAWLLDVRPAGRVEREGEVRFAAAARARWTPGNPARDQCGVTALVLNDLLGGDLVRGEVRVGGVRTDYHWWNRLGEGVEIGLTREQFRPEEIVTGGVVIPRPPQIKRLREEHELLCARVLERLAESVAA